MTARRLASLLAGTLLMLGAQTGCASPQRAATAPSGSSSGTRAISQAASPFLPADAVVSADWDHGTVAVLPDTSATSPALRVMWYRGSTATELGVIPGTTPAVELAPSSDTVLLLQTGGSDLWVARPVADSLRRFAQVEGGFQWGTTLGLVWWCSYQRAANP